MLERVGVILLLSLALIELEYDWKIFSLLLIAVLIQLVTMIMDCPKENKKKTLTEDEVLTDFINAIKSYIDIHKETPLKVSVSFDLLELGLKNQEFEDKISMNETEDVFILGSRLALNLNLKDYTYVIIPRGKKC